MPIFDATLSLGFLAAAMLVTLSPGPDNMMILGLGLSRGRRAGTAFGLGCALGCLSHTTLAALGIGALIAASPLLFTGLRLAGGAYLLWLGFNALRAGGALRVEGAKADDEPSARLFRRGLIANAVNPKVILFFLAFLPQFVDADRGDVAVQTALLGLIFTAQACVLFGLLGWFSGTLGGWINRHGRVGPWLDRLAGGVFVALGAKLILDR